MQVPCLPCCELHLQCWTSADWMPFALHQTTYKHRKEGHAVMSDISLQIYGMVCVSLNRCVSTTHPDVSCSCSACTMLRRLASARAWVKCVYGAMKQ